MTKTDKAKEPKGKDYVIVAEMTYIIPPFPHFSPLTSFSDNSTPSQLFGNWTQLDMDLLTLTPMQFPVSGLSRGLTVSFTPVVSW